MKSSGVRVRAGIVEEPGDARDGPVVCGKLERWYDGDVGVERAPSYADIRGYRLH